MADINKRLQTSQKLQGSEIPLTRNEGRAGGQNRRPKVFDEFLGGKTCLSI